MINLNDSKNVICGNNVCKYMYRMLDGYTPSSNSSSKGSGSKVSDFTSKTTSFNNSNKSSSTSSSTSKSSSTSSSSGYAKGGSRSSNTSSRGSFNGGGFGGTRYSSGGSAPSGAEFLLIPVANVKGNNSLIKGNGTSRNSGTISYDLSNDITSRGKIVNGKVSVNNSTNNSNNNASNQRVSIFTRIFNFFTGKSKKNNTSNNTSKVISPSAINYMDSKAIRSNYTNTNTRVNAVHLSNTSNNGSSVNSRMKMVTGRDSINNYTEYDVDKLASLIYRETGGSFLNSSADEEWFAFLNTAAVAMNNQAMSGTGSSVGDRICSLSNNVYAGLSDYANTDFDTVTQGASEEQKEKIRNAAKVVLSGQYTLPSNMCLQASSSIVNRYGNTWNVHNPSSGGSDVHIGYLGGNASSTDIYGNNVSSDVNSYRREAEALRQAVYSSDNTINSVGTPSDIVQL